MNALRKTSWKSNLGSVILAVLLVLLFTPVTTFGASDVIRQGPGDERNVTLTFDDGYDGDIMEEVLDILQQYEVNATFFLNGEAMYDHPELTRRVVEEGHELANHSHTHPDFTGLSSDEIFEEISLTEQAALEVTGEEISRLFRVPYGSFDQEVLNLLGEAGYPYTIQWTIDTLDWQAPSPETIHNRVMEDLRPGAIVLLHVNHEALNTPDALPMIIESLMERNYEMVTVSEMLFGDGIAGTHEIQSGETLYLIAEEYGVTVDALVDLNDIEDPNQIFAGQELLIPEGAEDVAEPDPEPEPEPEPDPEPEPEPEPDPDEDEDPDEGEDSDEDPDGDEDPDEEQDPDEDSEPWSEVPPEDTSRLQVKPTMVIEME